MNPNREADTDVLIDVLIAGAGPVGLFLANECARRGLRWRLVESSSMQSEHSKALAIFPRTLEIFDMAGVSGPFLEAANRVTSVAVLHCNRTLARMHFAPEESPYRFVAMVPQNVTEALLLPSCIAKAGKSNTTLRSVRRCSTAIPCGPQSITQAGARKSARGSWWAATARTAPYADC